MSFRARTTSRRGDRSRGAGRRTLATNVAFALIIVASLLILAGAAAASYYGDHLAVVSTVNGSAITKDDLRDRYSIDIWRINSLESQVRNAVTTGRLTAAERDQQITAIEQQKTNAGAFLQQSLQNLIDARLQAQLASSLDITVTPADVAARLLLEATAAEARHIWIIEFKPEVTAPAITPTAAQLASAKLKSTIALSQLKSGVPWETVAAGTLGLGASGGGDQGFVEKDGSTLDPTILDTLFAMKSPGITDVLTGADGTFRIGRLDVIIPQSVDTNYQDSITSQGVSLDLYKQAVTSDLIRKDLQDRIVSDATTKPSDQRHVLEIMLTQDVDQSTGQPIVTDTVDSKHILYAPNADPSASAPPSTDPSWEVAHQRALATYQILIKDPSQFAAIATRDSADTGSAANGGDLGYLSQASLVKPFGDAIFKPGLTKNEILPPVETQFGWHVIQFVDRKQPARTRMDGFTLDLAKPGADFVAIAKANSAAADASTGGDMGWVAPDQLAPALQDAIDKTAVGKVSAVATSGTSVYLFKVIDEQTRLPDAAQITALKSNAFSNWYAGQQATATIKTDPAYQNLGASTTGN
jgi:parvulin-like peptidyl-prolyl isomerase